MLTLGIIIQFIFLISTTFAAPDNITHVVQREGKATNFTCELPPNGWSECRFEHHDGSQGQCSVFSRDGGTVQQCRDFGQSRLSASDGVCQLEHSSVTNDHNGTWSCAFTEAKQKRGQLGQIVSSSALQNHARDFTLSILHEPSNIEAHPENGTSCTYNYLEWFVVSITMRNVAPKPKVQWTIGNQTIGGWVIKETEVSYLYQDLDVTERLHFNGKEDFDGRDLKYRVIIEVVDEFGNSTEEYVREGKINLNCRGCPMPNLSTTLASNFPTTQTTSSTPSTTTRPNTSTIAPTTSEKTTQPFSATKLTPIDCNFNLTDMSGPLQFPKPGTICTQPPVWIIHINCNGNCINIINININKMSCKETDPCYTSLKLTTSGDVERMISIGDVPSELSFKESQVTIEIVNLVDDFSFEGIYYFSE